MEGECGPSASGRPTNLPSAYASNDEEIRAGKTESCSQCSEPGGRATVASIGVVDQRTCPAVVDDAIVGIRRSRAGTKRATRQRACRQRREDRVLKLDCVLSSLKSVI